MKRFRSFLQRRSSRKIPQVTLQEQPEPEALSVQKDVTSPTQATITATNSSTLSIALRNDSTSSVVYAYVTGQALDNNNAIFLLQADGSTPYYPASPSSTQSPLSADVAIPLGAPGNTVNIQIPHIAGGRLWFSMNSKLTFLLNPGPALVEPSVTNPSDPSIDVDWGFCEFTFNSDQLYANISYVDFVSLPISLDLTTVASGTQHVSGIPVDGLETIAAGLRAQAAQDGQPWDQLIVPTPGDTSQPLRVLSPNQARVGNSSLFQNYYDSYVNDVYNKFAAESLSIDTQASFGVVAGTTTAINSTDAVLNIGGSTFSKPSTSDIFTCSTGPFATGSNAETNAIIPRLSAAFNRSTLLATNAIPAPANLYYENSITNYYAKIVHAANVDGKGYAFPYDDVQPTGGGDASGKVQAGDPVLWTVAVGGSRASAS